MLYDLVIFAIVTGAVTYVATDSIIWSPVRIVLGIFLNHVFPDGGFFHRKFVTLMYCPMCFGFWAGMMMAALGWGSWSAGLQGYFEAGCTGLMVGGALKYLFPFTAYSAEVGESDGTTKPQSTEQQ